MKNVNLQIRKLSKAGFSLVEMLVVIAVIGIIAAIAIPNIGSINSAARTSTAQRNAQSVASVYAAALAAGCTTTQLGTTPADAVAALGGAGKTPADGPFKTQKFAVPNLPASDTTEYSEMLKHLETANGVVVYSSTEVAAGP